MLSIVIPPRSPAGDQLADRYTESPSHNGSVESVRSGSLYSLCVLGPGNFPRKLKADCRGNERRIQLRVQLLSFYSSNRCEQRVLAALSKLIQNAGKLVKIE